MTACAVRGMSPDVVRAIDPCGASVLQERRGRRTQGRDRWTIRSNGSILITRGREVLLESIGG